ncbi:hypothetical protein SeLEV6574_g04322 [Synchytrium endobioticum]|uniref:Uncharacterized protein n=1 Tax=Synchytrium endobioticum TaxID=286115 RepID=A0A507CZR1_9FUNG|nr:hypothetical protein SeLEV6574_g04322 [Synchytrium endobioticum]
MGAEEHHLSRKGPRPLDGPIPPHPIQIGVVLPPSQNTHLISSHHEVTNTAYMSPHTAFPEAASPDLLLPFNEEAFAASPVKATQQQRKWCLASFTSSSIAKHKASKQLELPKTQLEMDWPISDTVQPLQSKLTKLVGTLRPGSHSDPIAVVTRELFEDILYAFFLYRCTTLLRTPPLQPRTVGRFLLIFIPMWYNYQLCVVDHDVILPHDSVLHTIWRVVRIAATFGVSWCAPSVFHSVEPTAAAFISLAFGLRSFAAVTYFIIAQVNDKTTMSNNASASMLFRATSLLPSMLLYIAGCFTLRELFWALAIMSELVVWCFLGRIDCRLGNPLGHLEWQRARDRLARMALILTSVCILDIVEVRVGVINGTGQIKLNVSNFLYGVAGVNILYGLLVMTRKQSTLAAPAQAPWWVFNQHAPILHHISTFLRCLTHACLILVTGLMANMLQNLYSKSLGIAFAPIVPPGAPILGTSVTLTKRSLIERAIVSTGGSTPIAPLLVRSLLTSALITDTWQQEDVFAVALGSAMMFSTIAEWFDSIKGWRSLRWQEKGRLVLRLCIGLLLAGPAAVSLSIGSTIIAVSIVMGCFIVFEEVAYYLI